MKYLSILMMFAFFASSPIAEARWSSDSGRELSVKEKRKQAQQEAKQARKEATKYYKDYMVQKRKGLILIKKIEDERSRDGSIRSFKVLYAEAEEEDDSAAMGAGRVIGGGSRGSYGGATVSEEAQQKARDAERRKYQKQIDKINAQIEAEKARIEESNLMTDQLQEFITKALE